MVAPLIERLCAERLIDDRRYLENLVAAQAERGHGPNWVRAELRKHGMLDAQAEACIAAYPDWIAQLKRARQKKFGTSPPSNYPDQQRQARFLDYRGFTGAQIRAALGFDTDLDTEREI